MGQAVKECLGNLVDIGGMAGREFWMIQPIEPIAIEKPLTISALIQKLLKSRNQDAPITINVVDDYGETDTRREKELRLEDAKDGNLIIIVEPSLRQLEKDATHCRLITRGGRYVLMDKSNATKKKEFSSRAEIHEWLKSGGVRFPAD